MNSRHIVRSAAALILLARVAGAQDAALEAAEPKPEAAPEAVPEPSPEAIAPDAAAPDAAAPDPAMPDAAVPGTAPPAVASAAAVEPKDAPPAALPAAAPPASAPPAPIPAKKPMDPSAIPDLRGSSRPTQRDTIGLEPSAPQATSVLGGVTPAFGSESQSSSDWIFDIHGFLQLPLRMGINKREDASVGQKTTVLHTPPVVPGDYETFEYSGISPDPYAQLNFDYGNRDVTATIIIAARTVSNANGYFNPPDQLGINDAFITFHPKASGDTRFNVHVGAFANRYGIMGEYDMGRYGTPLVARLGGVGSTGTAEFRILDMKASAEVGVMGQLNKSPVGVEPAGWNGFTDPNAGTSFAGHGHFGLEVIENVDLDAHAIYAFSQDDRATTTVQKDGNIGVYGGGVRASLQRLGHLYLGYAFTNASTARPVSAIIRVLNSPGGLGLMQEYLGMESEGTGQLNSFGAQYDWSLGNFMRAPKTFDGKGPDFVVSAFTLGTSVSSPVPEYDGVFKLKYGGAFTYSFLPFLAAGFRYDRVMADAADNTQTHAILSPRLIFKSGWSSRDQVVLQYSGYLYGSNVAPWVGYPASRDPTVVPDPHVVSLTGSIWW